MSRADLGSPLEDLLARQLLELRIPFRREHRFHETRRWRFDFAFDTKLAVEVEGGVFIGGYHTRGAGFRADCEKYNAAAELGWTVLRYTDREIRNKEAVAQIVRLFTARGGQKKEAKPTPRPVR